MKRERQARAWPQRQLAEIAGVDLRTIQRLEKDGAASYETLMGVAQALEIEIKNLTSLSKSRAAGEREVHHLPRLTSGRELAKIIGEVDQFQVEHDEADDQRAVNAMVDITNHLKKDIVRWHDADQSLRMRIEFELSQEIKGLEKHGFYLFGTKRSVPVRSGRQNKNVKLCTIFMSHAKSPKIVRDKNANMMMPAVVTELF